MGTVRARKFDAVIGVGGIGTEAQSHGINGKVNWIGIGPHKHATGPEWRGPLVTFDHFVLFEDDGPEFHELAPNLAERVYATPGRCPFMEFDTVEQSEIERILKLAESEPASTWEPGDLSESEPKCRPKCRDEPDDRFVLEVLYPIKLAQQIGDRFTFSRLDKWADEQPHCTPFLSGDEKRVRPGVMMQSDSYSGIGKGEAERLIEYVRGEFDKWKDSQQGAEYLIKLKDSGGETLCIEQGTIGGGHKPRLKIMPR